MVSPRIYHSCRSRYLPRPIPLSGPSVWIWNWLPLPTFVLFPTRERTFHQVISVYVYLETCLASVSPEIQSVLISIFGVNVRYRRQRYSIILHVSNLVIFSGFFSQNSYTGIRNSHYLWLTGLLFGDLYEEQHGIFPRHDYVVRYLSILISSHMFRDLFQWYWNVQCCPVGKTTLVFLMLVNLLFSFLPRFKSNRLNLGPVCIVNCITFIARFLL